MTEESKSAQRAAKSSNIICAISELFNIPLEVATDIYYKSPIAELIDEGVADLQCRSNKYLATLVWEEHEGTP